MVQACWLSLAGTRSVWSRHQRKMAALGIFWLHLFNKLPCQQIAFERPPPQFLLFISVVTREINLLLRLNPTGWDIMSYKPFLLINRPINTFNQVLWMHLINVSSNKNKSYSATFTLFIWLSCCCVIWFNIFRALRKCILLSAVQKAGFLFSIKQMN